MTQIVFPQTVDTNRDWCSV